MKLPTGLKLSGAACLMLAIITFGMSQDALAIVFVLAGFFLLYWGHSPNPYRIKQGTVIGRFQPEQTPSGHDLGDWLLVVQAGRRHGQIKVTRDTWQQHPEGSVFYNRPEAVR